MGLISREAPPHPLNPSWGRMTPPSASFPSRKPSITSRSDSPAVPHPRGAAQPLLSGTNSCVCLKDRCWHPGSVFLQKTNGFDAAQLRRTSVLWVFVCDCSTPWVVFGGQRLSWPLPTPCIPGSLGQPPGLCMAPTAKHILALPTSCSFAKELASSLPLAWGSQRQGQQPLHPVAGRHPC